MKHIFWTLFIVLCVAGTAFAQPNAGSNPLDPKPPKAHVLIGPVLGGTRNYHTGGFRTISDPICPIFENGTGWGPIGGIGAEFQIGEKWSLIPRLCYDSRPGKFEQVLPNAKVLIPGTDVPVDQTVSMTSSVTYQMFTAELLYKREFAQIGKVRFGVAAGPVGSFIIGGTNRQIEHLDEPANARLINPDPANYLMEDNGRTLVFFNGDIPGRNSIRFSVKGGFQAEFGLFGNAWVATPGVYYDYGITKVTGAENWNLNSILFEVDFRRAF